MNHAVDTQTDQLADRLLTFVLRHFKNRSEFARASEMTPQTLNDYTSGRRLSPGADILRRWADLGMNINWLLTGRGIDFIDEATDPNMRVAELEVVLGEFHEKIEDALKIGPRHEHTAGLTIEDAQKYIKPQESPPSDPPVEVLPHRLKKSRIREASDDELKKKARRKT